MKFSDKCLLGVGFLLLWGFYLWRAAPTITIGDAAELAAAGGTLGIAHSPGYPLYVVLTRLGCGLIPFAGTAYRATAQSAFWTAASVGMISLCLLQLTGSLGISLLTGLIVGCGPLWMSQSVVTEVFGLNSFLAAVLLFLALRSNTKPMMYLCAYLLGIGLGNNHTLVLIAPALAVAFWPVIRQRPVRSITCLTGFFALGLSLYCFVPLRARRMPLMDWEEPATWERFWKLFTRARYGSFQLAQGSVPQITWDGILSQLGYIAGSCWQNFGPWSLAIILSLWSGIKKGKGTALACLWAAFFFSGPFFLIWTNLAVTFRTRMILDRFMYLPLVPAALLLGVGLSIILGWLETLKCPRAYATAVLALAGLIWTSAQAKPFERNSFFVWDMGRDLLRNAPPGTLLFADRADEAEFSMAFLQRAEHFQTDVHFIDCNAGVTASLYGPNYYDIWGRPRLALRTAEERRRIALWNGPVMYATHDPNMIPIPRVQEGLLFAVPGKGAARRRTPWDQLLVFRRPVGRDGQPAGWDRGLFADYLELLAQDAFASKNNARGFELYRGAELYAHR